MLPASLTEEEYQAVKAKASYYDWGHEWLLKQGDVMAVLSCGISKATRIRAQALARLYREHPKGPIKSTESLTTTTPNTP